YADDEIDDVILVGVNFDVIRVKKCKRRRERGTFVAVDKGMIAADAMKVCGRHLENRFVKEDPAESCFDISHRRQKKVCVTNPGSASEQTDLFFVSDEHFIESEEKNTH